MRNFVLLFIASLLFHLAGTWTLPLLDRDEPRFAEASREMLQGGDYVVPYFNGHYRFDKPPLTYWVQTVSYRSLGTNDFAARLPSAIAASLTALLVFAWGKRIRNERLGWWAALIFTLSFQTVVHAKAAVADMWLVLFVTGAHWAGYELLRDRLTSSLARFSRTWWWLFYLSLTLAFLAKGPIGWTPLLTVAATTFFIPGSKLNRRFLFANGMLLVLSIVASWGVPALTRSNFEFLRVGLGRHVLERSVGVMDGHGSGSVWAYLGTLPFYLVTIFLTFFPWALKLPWLARRLWRARDPLDNYLIAGAAIIFIAFTLVRTKLPHYTLPAFPLLALLLAKALLDWPNAERFVRRTAIASVCVGLIAACASPFVAPFFPSAQLFREARDSVTPEMEWGAVEYREPSLVWYFRGKAHGFMTDLDTGTAKIFMETSGPRFVVLPTRLVPLLFPHLPNEWKSFSARGLALSNGARVQLTLLLKPS